ncbi:MAG: glutamate mutase L [Anaerolineales bacterium]|nr:glutamate mutase L [Anaerolineales bacterium]
MGDQAVPRSQLDADSLLLLNVGTAHTRASLIDIVERQYRMVATAEYSTTADAPYSDVGEGVRFALDQLSAMVGCDFFDESGQLIVPSRGSGTGVDAVVLTLSLQADVRVALIGLLPDISLRSLRKLTDSAPVRAVAEISLGDRRTDEGRMDALCQAKPDLILVSGGSEGGASDAVLRLMEVVGLSIYMMPAESKPQVLFMGNSAVAGKVQDLLKAAQCSVSAARNIRPSLENEDLDPGRVALNEMTAQILRARLGGIEGLLAWTGGVLTPSPLGLGTVVQLQGRSAPPKKGALGISIGSGSTTLAAGFGETLELSVRPDLNLGRNAPRLLEFTSWRDIVRWLPMPLSEGGLRDYLHNKALYPRTVPATAEDLRIELAMVREGIRAALRAAFPTWRVPFTWPWAGLMPPTASVLGSGSAFSNVPKPGYAALTLLDAVQPTGITRLILDAQNMICALGAAGRVNPLAVVQVLDSPAFPLLGTAVCPVGKSHFGDPVLRYRLQYADGRTVRGDVRFGTIDLVPLPLGQKAQITIQLHRHFDLGLGGYGQGGTFAVEGGLAGLIIDGRGRPLAFESDAAKNRKLQDDWLTQITV